MSPLTADEQLWDAELQDWLVGDPTVESLPTWLCALAYGAGLAVVFAAGWLIGHWI